MDMGFPRFRGAVRGIVLASAAIYLVILLLVSFTPPLGQKIVEIGTLDPEHVLRGWVWQFVTYGFVSIDPLSFVLVMVGIYFIGSAVEERIGSRKFTELYFFSIIGAGAFGFLASLTGVVGQGLAFSAGAAANGLLMVFYLLYRDAPIMLFPLPIQIPVKYIVIFSAAIEAAYLLLSHFALFYIVMLSGLASGYLWHLVASRRTRTRKSEGPWQAMRNRYYRWKRRRAARKFEVYMRKQDPDSNRQYFDEYGNYLSPDDKKKDDGESRKPWIH
jgi:membrane associated rhomboid family serine protease